ncbi:MAG: hydrogenase nickel incorporation protein HypB [Candidatus Binatia bacterium]
MCQTCGCGDPAVVPVDVHASLLAGNDRQAAHNREHLAAHGVLAVNLMGSPGAGKTAVLEATARAAGDLRLGAITGDLATDNDANRLRAVGVPSVAITTGTACHLDAALVHGALHDPAIHDVDVLFVENVGNLVCPAVYDVGAAAQVVVLAVTEGEDKPLKYPVMFAKADLVLLTKIDLLPHLPRVRTGAILEALARVMPEPACIAVSAETGEGIEQWLGWLRGRQPATSRLSPAARAAGLGG